MSQVNDWSDGYTSDYLRNLNAYGPASANVPRSSVVSHQVRYRAPDTSDIPLAPGQNPEDSVYSNASGARMGQTKPASGYRAPAGGGYTAQTFPHETAGRRYARSKITQSRSRGGAPANGVKTRSAPLSGADVTADVLRSVKAAGNTSFANWRQSLVNQGWSQAEADAVRYDPSTGKFMSNASGQAATDHYMREQADKDAGIMADNPEVEGKVSGQTPAAETPAAETPAAETPAAETPAGQTPAKTEGGAQPAPAKTEGGAQPAPAKTEGSAQPAPVSGAQPAPVSGAQSDAEIEQLRAQMRAEVNKLRGFGDFGNKVVAFAQQWGDKVLSDSGKSDVEQMQEMIKHLQWWNSIAPYIVKMNGGN